MTERLAELSAHTPPLTSTVIPDGLQGRAGNQGPQHLPLGPGSSRPGGRCGRDDDPTIGLAYTLPERCAQ
jgi:hypothetical protein